MTTPAVVEKQVVDIDINGGLDEYSGDESIDWTKAFKVSDNLEFDGGGRLSARRGLYSVADEWDTNQAGSYPINPILRLMSTGSGVLALGGPGGAAAALRAYHLNESSPTVQSNTKAVLSDKGYASEYQLYPRSIGGLPGGALSSPVAVGAAQTARYNISVVTPNKGVDYFVYFQDRGSGNIVRSYVVPMGSGSAAIALVAGRYLHLYTGRTASAKVWQWDTESLPDSVPSAVTLTSGSNIVAAVANSASSVVLMANGNMSRVGITPTETATGSVAGFSGTEIHDMATDGANFYIVGLNATPRGLMKVVGSNLTTVSRTVTDTDATLSAARFSVGVDGSAACYLIAYYTTTVGAFTMPTARVITVSAAATTFIAGSAQVMPCWGQVSSPFYNTTTGAWYAVMVSLPDAGAGAGHSTTTPGGSVCLVRLNSEYGPGNSVMPGNFHVAAVLDNYLDYVGNNSLTKGNLTGADGVPPQKIYTNDAGLTLVVTSIQRLGPNAYGSEFRELKLYDMTCTVNTSDAISGGRTSSYDGTCLSEHGIFGVPWITGVNSGAGSAVDIGLHSYVCVFEHIDALGRRHFSRMSNPFSITMASAKNVTVTVSYPNISDHTSTRTTSSPNNYLFQYHVYRTTAGGTQYYLVGSGPVQETDNTTAILQMTDSVTDAALVSNPLLYRQPGTQNTALDRYTATASSCVVRHKDRTFIARGSTVYFSSFDVYGEATWFNPALSFVVPGGVGDITAMASMDGILVIFKGSSIFIVDGDGPPENGGNGTEYSPPRRLMTSIGCMDARTMVHTDLGIMFRSARGIELLDRKLQVQWLGKRVINSVNSSPYSGGAAFDTATGRVVWLVSDTAGAYPGQLNSGGVGYALVYSTANDVWTRYKLRTVDGYGYPFQDVCYADVGSQALSIASAGRLVFADYQKVWFEYGLVDHDSSDVFIPIQLETGWVKSQSKQDRIKVTDFMIGAIKSGNCTLATSYAVNYSPSYVAAKTWLGSATSGLSSVVQLDTQPPIEEAQSISFKITTADPTPTSFGTGGQFQFFALSVRLGVKGGGAKLPAAQKG